MNKSKVIVPIMGAITILSIVALVVVLTMQSSSPTEDKILAKVNGQNITQDELFTLLYDQPTESGAAAGDLFLEQLVNDTVLRQQLKKTNTKVSDSELEERLDLEIENMVEMYGSRETLDMLLTQSGLTVDDLKDMMRDQLPDQIKMEKMFADEVDITDEEVAAFYEENKEQFMHQEQLELAHIVVAEEAEAEEVLAEVEAGEDFAALAKKHSIDSSADNGGALGWHASDEIVFQYGEEFAEAVSSLEVGELSSVIAGEDGYYIIKVTDSKDAGVQPLEEVHEQIEKGLYDEQIGSLVNEWVEEQFADADIEYMVEMGTKI